MATLPSRREAVKCFLSVTYTMKIVCLVVKEKTLYAENWRMGSTLCMRVYMCGRE